MGCRSCGDNLELSGSQNWAVGITTAPRGEYTLGRTADSLRAAGWEDFSVFAEPGSPLDGIGDARVVQRLTRFGAWHNWREMCLQLLEENPNADTIFTVQDDVEFVENIRDVVQSMLWPAPDAGAVTLYTAKHYAHFWEVVRPNKSITLHLTEAAAKKTAGETGTIVKRDRSPGLHRIPTRGFWGACAMIWPRIVLETALSEPVARNWKGAKTKRVRPREDWEVANVDTAIGSMLARKGRRIYAFTPSLAAHFATKSSIGHGGNKGRRNAIDFPGVKADAAELFRENSPAVLYYADGSPVSIGDREYDDAAAEWFQIEGRVSFSIAWETWREIRRRLRPGMRTIEFGSGLSTMLFEQHDVEHTAIEQFADRAAKFRDAIHSPLSDNWYNWRPTAKYDLILIDGPQGLNRNGVVPFLPYMTHENTVVIVDDTHREQKTRILERMTKQTKTRPELFRVRGRGFAIFDGYELREKCPTSFTHGCDTTTNA